MRRTLEAYSQHLHLINGNNIAEGIRPILLPGHTPSHTGYLIGSGRDRLMIWGDIVHFPYIQSSHPEVSILFDYNPVQAEEIRKKILKQVITENIIIAGMHLDMPGFAYVYAAGSGYRIEYINEPMIQMNQTKST